MTSQSVLAILVVQGGEDANRFLVQFHKSSLDRLLTRRFVPKMYVPSARRPSISRKRLRTDARDTECFRLVASVAHCCFVIHCDHNGSTTAWISFQVFRRHMLPEIAHLSRCTINVHYLVVIHREADEYS